MRRKICSEKLKIEGWNRKKYDKIDILRVSALIINED